MMGRRCQFTSMLLLPGDVLLGSVRSCASICAPSMGSYSSCPALGRGTRDGLRLNCPVSVLESRIMADEISVSEVDNSGEDKGTLPATQDELNAIIAKRLQRGRAKFSDYDDLKVKASKVDEVEAARQADIQALSERAAEAEKAVEAAKVEALRLRIAAESGVSVEDAEILLTGTDEETLRKQAERLTSRAPKASA